MQQLQPGSAVPALAETLDHLPQGEGNGLGRLKKVLQQSAKTAADAESKVPQLLGVQQQLAAAHLEAASLRVSYISCTSTLHIHTSCFKHAPAAPLPSS